MGKKNNWKKKRKENDLVERRYQYYIFCEGAQTEPRYFEGFKHLIETNAVYRNMVLVEIKPCGAETMRIIQAAEEFANKNELKKGQIWCVYDKDSFPAEHFNGVVARAGNLNRENTELQYHTAWSNECIEFWFLLHFAYYTSNNNRSEYVKFLNGKYSELGLGKYEKNDPNIFNVLMNYGKPNTAIKFAKRIIAEHPNATPTQIAPGTKVFELVEELAQYLPDFYKEKFLSKQN